MKLDDASKKLIQLLIDEGYKAYAVGGSVRDAILGRECKDIDITTSATPNEIEAVLDKNNIHYVETGLKHGTISAIINHIPYEITTFRKDGDYKDNRHPSTVEFVTDIKDDLSRRDFTMNAIAYNDVDGFVDFFGGHNDIENKIIRCVGNADDRFKEDALRIMRAIRFASVLGFEIEAKTKKAIFDNKELLNNIAVERIFVELVKLLNGDYACDILLKYREIIAVIIPEIEPCLDYPQNTKWHIYDVYTHLVKTVQASPKVDYMRLTALLHDIGKPLSKQTDENGVDHFKGHAKVSGEIARQVLRRFKVSNELYYKVVTLVENHDCKISQKQSSQKRMMRKIGEGLIFDLIDFKISDLYAHNLDLTQIEIDDLLQTKSLIQGIIDRNEPYLVSHLAINGKDLVELGYNGSKIKEELDDLVCIVSGQPELNTREYLLKQAKKNNGA